MEWTRQTNNQRRWYRLIRSIDQIIDIPFLFLMMSWENSRRFLSSEVSHPLDGQPCKSRHSSCVISRQLRVLVVRKFLCESCPIHQKELEVQIAHFRESKVIIFKFSNVLCFSYVKLKVVGVVGIVKSFRRFVLDFVLFFLSLNARKSNSRVEKWRWLLSRRWKATQHDSSKKRALFARDTAHKRALRSSCRRVK